MLGEDSFGEGSRSRLRSRAVNDPETPAARIRAKARRNPDSRDHLRVKRVSVSSRLKIREEMKRRSSTGHSFVSRDRLKCPEDCRLIAPWLDPKFSA